jgi:hypothetical protein
VVNARISGTSPDSHRKKYSDASVYHKASCFLIFTGAIADVHNLSNQTMQTI